MRWCVHAGAAGRLGLCGCKGQRIGDAGARALSRADLVGGCDHARPLLHLRAGCAKGQSCRPEITDPAAARVYGQVRGALAVIRGSATGGS